MDNAADNKSGCLEHSGILARISELENRDATNSSLIQKIFDKLDEIKTTLLHRPGWTVTAIISLLSTAVGICITLIVKKG